MGDEADRLGRIEHELMKISGHIGGIHQFMQTSTAQTTELFNRLNNIQLNGCANYPEHEAIAEKVEAHERVLNKATGIWIATSTIGGSIGAFIAWIVSVWHSK